MPRRKKEKPIRTLLPFFTKVGLNSFFKLYLEGRFSKKNILPFLELEDVETRLLLNPKKEFWDYDEEKYIEREILTVKIESRSWMEIDEITPIVRELKQALDSTNLQLVGSKFFLIFKGLRGRFTGLPRIVLDFFKTFEGGRQELLISPFANISYDARREGDDMDHNMGFWYLGYDYEDQKLDFINTRRGNTSYEHFLMICHGTLETISAIKGTYPQSMETAIVPSIRCDSFVHDYQKKSEIYIEIERSWNNIIPKTKKYNRLRKRKFKVIFYVPDRDKEKCYKLKLKPQKYELKFYKYLPSSPIITKTTSENSS